MELSLYINVWAAIIQTIHTFIIAWGQKGLDNLESTVPHYKKEWH